MTIYTTNSEINRNILTKGDGSPQLLELPLATRRISVQAINGSATLTDGVQKAIYDLDAPAVYVDTTSSTNALTTTVKVNSIFSITGKTEAVLAGELIVAANVLSYKPAAGIILKVGDAVRFSNLGTGDAALAKDISGRTLFVTAVAANNTYSFGGFKTNGITNTAVASVNIIKGITAANNYYDTTTRLSSVTLISGNRYKVEMNHGIIGSVAPTKGYGELKIFSGSDCLKKKTGGSKSFNIVAVDATGVTIEDPDKELIATTFTEFGKMCGELEFQIGENPIDPNSVNTWDNENYLSIDMSKFAGDATSTFIVDSEQIANPLNTL